MVAKDLRIRRAEVLGILALIFHECTERELDAFPESVIDVIAERNGFAKVALRHALLERDDARDELRVKGALERIQWIIELRRRGKRGGKAGKNKRKSGLKLTLKREHGARSSGDIGAAQAAPAQTLKRPRNAKKNASENDAAPAEIAGEKDAKAYARASLLALALVPDPALVPARVSGDAGAPRPKRTRKAATADARAAKSAAVWEAYTAAMRERHDVEPKDNPATRSQACRLVDLLGSEDAVAVTSWYVTRETDADVSRKRHPFGWLVKGYETYYANWQKGGKISKAEAKGIERDDANLTAVNAALKKFHARTKGGPPA